MVAKAKKVENYSAEDSAKISAAYTASPTKATVDALAKEFGKSPRSIVAKLVNLGVYVKADKAATEGESKETKGALVAEIAKMCDVAAETFDSLESATKKALLALRDKLKEDREEFAAEGE